MIAQRMKSNVGGSRKDTEIVMIEFQGEVAPKGVMLGLMSYIVRDYIPRPMRCFNCQKFGLWPQGAGNNVDVQAVEGITSMINVLRECNQGAETLERRIALCTGGVEY